MDADQNILCISPVFVPVANSEAYCGAKMAAALKDSGIRISVLTLGNACLLPDCALDDSNLWSSVSSSKVAVNAPAAKNRFLSAKTALRYRTDGWARWIDRVIAHVKLLHEQIPFTMVYSRSLPMFSHIAGYWCSKAINVPWVANINDPWDIHYFPDGSTKTSAVHAVVSAFWMRQTLREAALITYPCYRLWKFHETLSGIKHSAAIIPHIGSRTIGAGTAAHFNVVHAGKLGKNEISGRPTSGIIAGISKFLDQHQDARGQMKLTLVGPLDPETQKLVMDFGIGANVIHIGRVSYEESLEYIDAASVCLLVEGDIKEGIYLPSKLADYLVAKKPVLALSPSEGTVNDIASDSSGIMRVDPGDSDGIAEALSAYYAWYRQGTLCEKRPSDAVIRCFLPGTVANIFLAAAREAAGCVCN